jgi:hypothetical protein
MRRVNAELRTVGATEMSCGSESALPGDILNARSQRLGGIKQPLCMLQANAPDMTHYRSAVVSE